MHAVIIAGIPSRLSVLSITNAAINEDRVCPDGCEKSVGLLIRSGKPVSVQLGLGLAISGFNVRLPIKRPISIQTRIKIPHLRYFFVKISITAMAIQSIPPLPKAEKKGIIKSINPHSKAECTDLRI